MKLVCANCQSSCFEEEMENGMRCLDCLAVTDKKTGQLIEIDGIRA